MNWEQQKEEETEEGIEEQASPGKTNRERIGKESRLALCY